MICGNCKGEIPVKVRGRGRRAEKFCRAKCRSEFYSLEKSRALKALRRRDRRNKPLFENEIQKPENQKRIAGMLAWAEAQNPATCVDSTIGKCAA